MKLHHRWAAAVLFVGVAGVSSVTNAALVSRLNGQAFYDTDLNITLLADANLAATNSFGVSGIGTVFDPGTMAWDTAQNWIAAMNANNYLGYNDWRLPTVSPVNGAAMNYNFSFNGTTDYGYNISAPGTLYAGSKGSELAYLYYSELGNKAYCDTSGACNQPGSGFINTGPFSNILTGYGFWTGTEDLDPYYYPNYAWRFSDNGSQQGTIKANAAYAWAVRTGDVTAVPVPAAFWFFGSGLLGLIGIARRKTV